jgi:1-deoxyxylulose-5-phosphate synthase
MDATSALAAAEAPRVAWKIRMMRRSAFPFRASRIVLGTAWFALSERPKIEQLLDAVFELGGNVFDTARCYGDAERILGEWVQARGIRSRVAFLTKGVHPDLKAPAISRVRPDCIDADLRASLDRLGTDSIDIYFLHRDDPAVPVGELIHALNEHRDRGRVRAFGASNWSLSRIREANAWAARREMSGFTAMSPHCSLARWARPPWPGCVALADDDIEPDDPTIFAWSPLAAGFFSGRTGDSLGPAARAAYDTAENREALDRASQLSRRLGASVAEIALAYVLTHPSSPFALVGARRAETFASSLRAVRIELRAEERAWLRRGG